MTTVGHSLTGAAIGLVAAPAGGRPWRKAAIVAGFVVLANIPDLPLPHWGHARYQISHSLFVNLGLIALVASGLLVSARLRHSVGGARVVGAGALAWLSHLLMDTFYNHGLGLAMFWPLSRARLALPIPWFETVRKPFPHVDWHTARVWGIELLAYGLVLAAVVLGRRMWVRHRRSGHREAAHGPSADGGARG